MASHGRAVPDYEDLADVLRALAYPVRLEILEAVRSPCTLRDIQVSSRLGGPGGVPGAGPAARTTVRAHLLKLVDAGIVDTDEVDQRGRSVPRYRCNRARLYGLLEDMVLLPSLQLEPLDVVVREGQRLGLRLHEGPWGDNYLPAKTPFPMDVEVGGGQSILLVDSFRRGEDAFFESPGANP